MPTIAIFYGIVIQMYWRDHNPPHFHAYYQGHEALISIESGALIAGQMSLGPRRILKEWTLRHQPELLANWERCKIKVPLNTVRGADEE